MSTKYYIYPAIGIARVGNSKDEFLIGPEITGQKEPIDPKLSSGEEIKYKDEFGKVKRQAARFRIYEVDDQGTVIREIVDSATTSIDWRVHLANRKPINYQFKNAMDLGKNLALDMTLRNPDIVDLEERKKKLLLDSGTRNIQGVSRNPDNATGSEDFTFDSAKFYEGTAYQQDVYLGELRTDEQGRLLVLGGRGKSASFDGAPAITFANNNGWHDDVSDGTVRATLSINGKTVEAEPAMVAVTPPNFAPGIEGTVTMLDVIENLFEEENLLAPIQNVSFYKDIYPIFKSLVDNQAVNSGFYFLFGENSPGNFTSEELLPKISSNSEEHADLRNYIFSQFRPSVREAKRQRVELLKELKEDYSTDNAGLSIQVGDIALQAITSSQEAFQADKLPPFYGDAYGEYKDNPLSHLSLTNRQYDALKKWAEGDFVTGEINQEDIRFEDLDLQDQPKELSKSQLAQCLGGPFHPGIELTWFLRRISMWNVADSFDAMRLNVLPEDEEVQDYYGPVLTPEVGLEKMFNTSGPGTLTRFMGVPWQTDEASCRSGQDYDPAYYLPLASFWSARVPNQVLSQRSFQRLNDPSLPPLQRVKHLNYRKDWLRFFPSTVYEDQINGMVRDWDKIGIVKEHKIDPLLEVDGYALSSLWVESEVNKKFTVNDPTFRLLLHMEALPDGFYETSTKGLTGHKSEYVKNLRELENDDISFAESAEPKRKTYTRQEIFGKKDS